MSVDVPEAAGAAEGPSTSAPRSRDVGLLLAVAVFVCCFAVVSVALVWRAGGGRWAVVETPSMGQAIPVGSLVLIQPRPLDSLQVGDVVTYRPPPNGTMFTHRIVGHDERGIRVQGDINGSMDPYPLTGEDLVGKVVAHWRGVGHLVRALPFLLVAQLVLLLGTRNLVRARWRSTVRVLGTCFSITLCELLLRPFVRPVLMSTVPVGDEVQVTVVSGGMFPTRVLGAPGQQVELHAGQVGTITALPTTPGGPAMVVGTPHLTGWWLVGVILVCLLPVVWCLLVGLSPEEDEIEAVAPAAVDGDRAVAQPEADDRSGDAPLAPADAGGAPASGGSG